MDTRNLPTTRRTTARLLSWVPLLVRAVRRVALIVAALALPVALTACGTVAVTGPDIPGDLIGGEGSDGEATSSTENADEEVPAVVASEDDPPDPNPPATGDPRVDARWDDLPPWLRGYFERAEPNTTADCAEAMPPSPC
jgi:hypothetical protein